MKRPKGLLPVSLLLTLGASIAIGSGVPPVGEFLDVGDAPVDDVVPSPEAPGDLPARLTPLRVRFTGAGGTGDPSALTDRDTRTAFAASGVFTLIFDLEQPAVVGGIRVFGRPDATLSIACASGAGWIAVPGLQGVSASLFAPGWNDLVAAPPCATPAIRVDVVSDGASTALPEIEIWGAGAAIVPASPRRLVEHPEQSLPDLLRSFDAPPAELAVEGTSVTARIEIPRPPSQFRRAYLLYELNGLTSWHAVPRAVNGRTAQGGGLDTPSLEWSPQIERLHPEWLREGTNEITFLQAAGGVRYAVRDVRILAELDSGGNAVELATTPEHPDAERGLSPAVDGELATVWDPFPETAEPGASSSLTLSLDRAIEPSSLGLLLASPPSGAVRIEALAPDGAMRIVGARNASDLHAGWNLIPLDPGFAASRLRIVLDAGSAGGWAPMEIVPLGSGVGGRAEPASLTIVWPYEGEFAGREATLRGFVTPDASGLPVRVTVGPTVVETGDGAFGVVVAKDDVGFADDEDAAPWSVGVQAVYADGRTLSRTVRLTRGLPGPHSIDGQLLGARSFSVQPGQAKKIRHDGAGLDLEAGSVDRPKELKVTPLRDEDLPALDTGMTNVTKGPRRGYRFEPHGSRFAKKVRVSLPYDASLLPDGMTEDDIRTFYFDDQAGRWAPLEHVAVDTGGKAVSSLTDHFTDMINATVTVPDRPELLSHEPTMFEKVPPADPAERIVLIEPPKASSKGDAQLSYRLDLPEGRGLVKEMDLDIEYSSGGANGWVGMGWSLGVPSVSLDTRWGAPRFDAALESETYQLAGEQLTPLAHRAALEARTSEKTFQLRREGRFLRIVRHGSAPTNYWWEVTDKRGVTSIYGGSAATTLADDQGRISRWLLSESRDPHGNGIRYGYDRVDDTGLPAGTVPGRQLYLKTINYPTFGGSAGAYTVTMIRDAELGEPRRPDVQIDARGGFKAVTSQLLRRVEVAFQGAPVRSWELRYVRGAFEKTLLESITQTGSDGSTLATHRFTYFDDVRDGADYAGFAPTESWDTGEDGVRSAVIDDLASTFGSDAGRPTALSGYESTRAGGHLYVGFNLDAPTKRQSVGGKIGFNGTVRSQGLLSLVDLNGDHLPDKLFKTSSGVFVRLNRSGPRGVTDFGPPLPLPTLPAFSEDSTATVSFGIESYVFATAIANEATGITTGLIYGSDVNGDGLSDIVAGGSVLFNRLDAQGVPTFDPDSATSPVPVGPAAVDGGVFPDLGPQLDRIRENAPLQDTLRRWTAPYPGQVRITGTVALQTPAVPGPLDDGVRVAIQHGGTELWSTSIAPGDTTAHVPAGVDAVEVQAGDHIYFRVQSGVEGSHDVVLWDPAIDYVGAPALTDVNGLNPYHARASEDFVLAGRPGALVEIPFTGRVRLVGDLLKTGVTTDAVTLLVLKNGGLVHADGLDGDETGTIPLGVSFDVAQDDTVQLRVRVDSPIDLRKLEWTPSLFYLAPPDGPAPTHTIDGNTVTIERVVDEGGAPLIQLHPPYDIDFYPIDGLSAPQNPWVAEDDGTVTVSSHLVATPDATGVVFMTAKRRGSLAAKRTIFIVGGIVQNRQVDIDVEEGDEIFFDYSCLDPELASKIGNRVIRVDGDAVPTAFHTTARQGVFPLPYRGWAVAGYNGNAPRDAQPIVESDLEVAYDDDSEVDPRTDKAYLFTPFPEGGIWRGPEEETFVSAFGAASSRLGPNAIPDPTGPGAPGRAPLRLSSSSQIAAELGVAFLSGSRTSGDGGSDVDFQDLNGDQYPDVVGRSRVQFSPAIGGLEAQSRDVTGLDAPRSTESTADNLGVGGSPANFRVGSRGQVDTPGRGGAPKENATGSQMASLGLSGGLGTGSSSVPYDLADLNGDGLPDRVTASGAQLHVAFNLGYEFAPSEPWGSGALNQGSSSSLSLGTNLGFNGGIYDYAGGLSLSRNSSETTRMLADINGDGLPDRLTRDGDAILVGLNTGNAFLADVAWGGAPQGAFATNTDASLGSGAYFTVGIGPVCLFKCWIILNPGVDLSTSLARQESALMDLDGDGFVDHVTSDDESELVVARNTTGRTNLLRSIARPLGATIDLDYERDGNTIDLPQSHWNLARVTVFDGLPGDGVDRQVATIRYEKGVWDRLEREFYGYGRVREEIRDSSQGDALLRTLTRDFAVDSFYTRGLLIRERLEDAAGRPFTETEHTYTVFDVATQAPLPDLASTTATAFPASVRTDRRFFEGLPAPGKSTYMTQEFDAVGNVVRTFDVGDAGPGDDLEAVFAYSNCPTSHILGAPVSITVRGDGNEMRRRVATLDCANGDVTSVTEYLDGASGAETVLGHDVYGNLTRVLGPPNRNGQRYETTYQFDPVVHIYPTQVADSFGLTSTTMFDLAQGRRTGTRDANGNRTTYTYDAHGRLTSMTGSYQQGGGPPTVTFEYHPDAPVAWSLTRHLDAFRDPADPIETARFVDGLNRVVQDKNDATVSTGAAGAPSDVMVVSGRLTFDAVGRVTEKRYPVVEPLGTPGAFRATPDPVVPTRTVYDVLDRPLRVTSPDGTTTSSFYGFGADRENVTQFEVRNVDANGTVSFSYKNVRELVTGIKELNRVPGGTQEIWTSYRYDALKQLTRIADDRGNPTQIVWDNLGRKTVVDSPDEGRTEDRFDLAGNRTARITANLRAGGRQITYDYEFVRLKEISYPDFPENRVEYVYGGPGAPSNGAGRVVRIVDPSGTRERAYGKLGEVVSEVRTIPSTIPSGPQVYTTGFTYDSFDRLQKLVYPDGEVLTLRYDSGGRIRNVVGRKAAFDYEYLRRMEYDKFGDRTFVEAGNGTRTSYAYRPDNRRLATVLATRSDGRPFVNMTYAYDDEGNVLSRTNAVPVATGSDFGGPTLQTFVYDDLDRLTSSHGSYQYAPNKTDRYVVAFDYDTIHNLTSRSQAHEIVEPSGRAVPQGKTSYAFAYQYGGPQPHAATHVGERTFRFDANGNQAGWQDDRNGTRRDIVWDEENRMRSLFDNGHEIRFVYDDKGERVIKRGPQGETVYVSPWLTVRNGTTGTKHVWAGPLRIASKLMKQDRPGGNPSGGTPYEKDRYFYHQDHTETTNFVTDAAGQLYEHLEYFPFGETWVQESSNTQRTPYAFTGKELDEETGLTYLGARFHDPRLGTFNSTDPLLFAKPEKGRDDTKFLSVYSYGNQNPERFLDPDGREVIIAVGQDNGKSAESKIIQAGWPAAARALQAKLAAGDKGTKKNPREIGPIASRIIYLDSKTSAADQIKAAADDVVAKGGTVSGLVYIGHGDPTTGMMVPTNTQIAASVKEFVDAARLGPGGAFYTYGCEVSVSKADFNHIQMVRQVDVYTTNGQWTWTHSGGTTGLGTSKQVKTGYGQIYNLHMRNIINGVKMNRRCMTCDVEPSMHEGLAEAENAIK